MKIRLFSFLSALLVLAGCATQSPQPDATYYLVRHAEKVLDVKDPELTAEGTLRAQDLAERLKNIKLTEIYSSDYRRTQDTAKPVSAQQGLNIISYDPRDLPGLADTLKTRSGNILVVGHSNTTPPLAELLGASPGEPIVEATEYDRLYVITRHGNSIHGVIERYGE